MEKLGPMMPGAHDARGPQRVLVVSSLASTPLDGTSSLLEEILR